MRLQELSSRRILRQVEVAPSAGHAVRALFEEAVGAEAMAKIEVLPRRSTGGSAVLDALTVDQHFDRAHVAGEVAGIGVRPGQRRGQDLGVVLR